MDVSQSRANSRGPLIAVIKIEIDVDRVDRIFLHHNDDDYQLAEDFQAKHHLSHNLVPHIYQRIQMSRESVQKQSQTLKPSLPSNRSKKSANPEQSSHTPIPKPPANDAHTPFDKISKFTPIPEETENQHKPFRRSSPDRKHPYVDSYRRELELLEVDGEDSGDFPFQKDTGEDTVIMNEVPVSSTYENDTNEDLFTKYLADKKKYESKHGIYVTSKDKKQELTNEESTPWTANAQRNQHNKISFGSNEIFQKKEQHRPKYDHEAFSEERTRVLKQKCQQKSAEQTYIESQESKLQKQLEQLHQRLHRSKQKIKKSQQQQQRQSRGNYSPEKSKDNNQFERVYLDSEKVQIENQLFRNCRPKVIPSSNRKQPLSNQNPKGHQSIEKSRNYHPQSSYEVSSHFEHASKATSHHERFFHQNSQQHQHQSQEIMEKPSRVKILKKQEMNSLRSSSMKKSLSKSDISKIQREVTSRLYNEGEIKKSYLKKIKERAKNEEEKINDPELTHKPNINKISKTLAEDRYTGRAIQDHLIEQGRIAEQKKEAERQVKEERALEGCSFVPEVSQVSRKLVEDRSRASILKQNQSRLNKTNFSCSKKHTQSQSVFRPSLNKMSEAIMKNKGKGDFNERMRSFMELKNTKLSRMMKEKIAYEKVDKDGKELFKPRINQGQSKNRSPKGSRIYDYLYQLSIGEKTPQKEDPKPKINQNSEMMVQQMQLKRITWVFSELDSDQDGFISSKRICIDTIDENILQVIMPVLFQMEQMDIQLNLCDFRKAIANLHSSLNTLQKHTLYNYSHKN